MPLKRGDRVDRFTIVELLGAGGMGQVFKAEDERLHRTVALKILREADAADPATPPTDGAARMLREARAAAALDHPNVVAIFDVAEAEEPASVRGTMYLAMELVRGAPLRWYVGREQVSIKTRVRWLVEIAKALGAAHERGLVHRDIKPENVMIREDGVVKILDFGIAKRTHVPADARAVTDALAIATTAGILVGTPFYMSPEQLRRDELDGRSDQFSWGVVAYELFCGAPPWGVDAEAVHLIAQVLSMPVAPPSASNPEVSKELDAIVLRALSKSRDDRFPTMADVVAALEGHVDPFAATSKSSVAPANERGGADAPDATPQSGLAGDPPADRVARRPRRTTALAFGAAAIAVIGFGVYRVRAARTASESTAAAPIKECTTNVECIRKSGGKPARCHQPEGVCALLESVDCAVHAEKADLENDETIWVGTMFPTGDPAREFAKHEFTAVELARRDFAGSMGSFRPPEGTPAGRPIALVACDDSVNPQRAARHLVEQARVPAVIGFATGSEVVELTNSLFVPRGVLTVASLNMSPLVTSVPQPASGPRLVWRTTYTTTITAEALAKLVADVLEPQVRKSPAVGARPIRVGLVRARNATGLSFSHAFFGLLRFNGKSALDNGADFREIVSDATVDEEALRDLLSFKPNILVFIDGQLDASDLLGSLERRWPKEAGARPVYATISLFQKGVLDLIGKDASRRRRFYGVTTVSTRAANAQFVMHLNASFPEKATRTASPNSSYDAFYVIAYASYALGNEPVTGAALARGIARLVPNGPAIDVGPTHIFDGFSALRSGKNIDLNGATGSLDFDLPTGEAPVSQAILCPAVDDSGAASGSIESGLVYDPVSKSLDGAMRCP